MFGLNELPVLLGAALQSISYPTPPGIITVHAPTVADPRMACPETQRYLSNCSRIVVLVVVSPHSVSEKRLFDIWGCVRVSSAGPGFATLQPCSIHKTEPLCWMHLQGTVFVRVWARQPPPAYFFCCYFFFPPFL